MLKAVFGLFVCQNMNKCVELKNMFLLLGDLYLYYFETSLQKISNMNIWDIG